MKLLNIHKTVVLACAIIFLTACGKDDDSSPPPHPAAGMITAHPWRQIESYSKYLRYEDPEYSDSFIEDSYDMDTCSMDDRFTFYADGRARWEDMTESCFDGQGPASLDFLWRLTKSGTVLQFSETDRSGFADDNGPAIRIEPGRMTLYRYDTISWFPFPDSLGRIRPYEISEDRSVYAPW